MSISRKITVCSILIILIFSFLINSLFPNQALAYNISDYLTFIVLSKYSAEMDIGSEISISGIASSGDRISWSSSNSKVAEVNTYGKVIAKKSGTARITAKVKNAEATCKIYVRKTEISLSSTYVSLERNSLYQLSAKSSNGSQITWNSSKKSIATVDEGGKITAQKPGETVITASADGTTVKCKVVVKIPTLKLNSTTIKLFRKQSYKLSADVSSKVTPTWKSNKTSVATVDETGLVTAIKNGTARITATVDGVSRTCEVIVQKPNISLSSSQLTLKVGSKFKLKANVSSNIPPAWSSSNSNVAEVNSDGNIKALKKGTAYIYASEDGTKVKCTIKVSD